MAKAMLAWSGHGLRVESLDGAGNVVHLEGQPAARLAHLALHRIDLQFAQACLAVIEGAPREECLSPDAPPSMTQWHTPALEAAWRSALLHYCKCFAPPQVGHGRSQLSATRILGSESGQPMKDHGLMMGLRNKHLVHDEGTHNWCAVAAVIAPTGKAPTVLGIKVAAMDSVTMDHLSVPALRVLVDAVQAWTAAEFDRVARELAASVNAAYSHDQLLTVQSLSVDYKASKGRK